MLRTALPSVALVASVVFGSPAFATAQTHEAAVKSFFKVAKMDELINSSLIQMTDVQVNANPAMAPYRDTLLKFFQKYMSWSSLEPDITKLYVKEFSEDEINQIASFYKTSVGQKVMKKLPELSAQGAAIGQARVQEHMSELQAMITAGEEKKVPPSSSAAPEAAASPTPPTPAASPTK